MWQKWLIAYAIEAGEQSLHEMQSHHYIFQQSHQNQGQAKPMVIHRSVKRENKIRHKLFFQASQKLQQRKPDQFRKPSYISC